MSDTLGYYSPDFGKTNSQTTAAAKWPSSTGTGYNPNPLSGDSDSGVYSAQNQQNVQAAGATAPATQQQAALPEFTYDLNGVNPTSLLDYNSYLRGYGFDKSSAQAQANFQHSQLQSQLQAGLPIIQQDLKTGLTDAGESAAAAGGARSSARLVAQDRVQTDAARREAALRAGIADKEAQNSFSLQDTLASLENRRSEAEFTARTTLVDQQNKQIAYDRALAALGLN